MIERNKTAIKATSISLELGGRQILDQVNFIINRGEKVALFGPNGVGKTTIIKLILGQIEPDFGEIELRKGVDIGYMPQFISEDDFPLSDSIFNFMLSARGLDQIGSRIKTIYQELEGSTTVNDQLLAELGGLEEEYELNGGHEAENRIKSILAGLGLSAQNIENTKISSLSGGQKTRLLFARVLFSEPNLLILDEPTNNLDQETVAWLADYLSEFKGTILSVSHQQDLLAKVFNKVLYLNPFTHQVETYNEDYISFVKQLEKEREKEEASQDQLQREEKEAWEFVNRWRGNKSKRGSVRQKLRRIEEIDETPELEK